MAQVDHEAIGRQLRARRTAAGRTVASVAADAGLSVPYVANLENGRGNPTATALTRLAAALGTRLVITLAPDEGSQRRASPRRPRCPPRSSGWGAPSGSGGPSRPWPRRSDADADEFSARLVAALAALAQATGRDLAEPDWWRLLDALVLVTAHPAAP